MAHLRIPNILRTRAGLMRRSMAAAAMAMISAGAMAQTDAQFTQYYEVPAYYNTAALGLNDFIRIRGGARMQWVGIDNAPRNFLAMADMPVKIGKRRIGVGLVMDSGSEGLFRNLSIDAQGAWHQPLFKGTLAIGIGIGYRDQKFMGTKVVLPDGDDFHQGTDDAIPTTDVSGSALNLSLGVHYTHRWFWAGLSCNHINQPTIRFSTADGGGTSAGGGGATDGEGAKNFEFQARRTLYFMAGSNIPIKNTLFEVMPSVFVKTDFTFTRAELTARVRYNRFLTAGVGYRYDDAVSVTLAAEYKNFFLGYAYDYPLSAISRASHGSHEIFAGYSLKLDFSEKNRNKHKSIRLM